MKVSCARSVFVFTFFVYTTFSFIQVKSCVLSLTCFRRSINTLSLLRKPVFKERIQITEIDTYRWHSQHRRLRSLNKSSTPKTQAWIVGNEPLNDMEAHSTIQCCHLCYRQKSVSGGKKATETPTLIYYCFSMSGSSLNVLICIKI